MSREDVATPSPTASRESLRPVPPSPLSSSSLPTESTPLLGDGGGDGNGDVGGDGARRTRVHRDGRENQGNGNAPGTGHDSEVESTELKQSLKIVVPAVALGVLLASIDSTLTIAIYATIGSSLNSLNLTSWIATAYFLSLTSFQPLYGKLSDIFGRKPCLVFAYLVFGLGTLLCGLATNIYFLIGARVVQGIGGGGMTTVVSILMSDIVPLQDRGLWQGLINIVYALGSSCGATFGGVIGDLLGWRWAFLVQVPVCVLAAMAVSCVLKEPVRKSHIEALGSKNLKAKLARIDFLGAIVLVVAVFGVVFGVDRGSNVKWKSPLAYGPLVGGALFFGIFMLVETKVATEPIAPGHIVFDRTLFAGYLCYFFGFAAVLSVMYFYPLFFQAVDSMTATEASVQLLPATIASVAGSLFGGWMLKRIGKYYWLIVTGFAILVAGVVLNLIFLGVVARSLWGTSIGLFLGNFGNGVGTTCSLIAVIANAAPEDQAVATASTYLFRSMGTTIGVSLSASLIQQVLRSQLSAELGSGKQAEEIEKGVRQSLTYIDKLEPDIQVTVRRAYGSAVQHGFVFMLALACCSLLASFFIREKKLRR